MDLKTRATPHQIMYFIEDDCFLAITAASNGQSMPPRVQSFSLPVLVQLSGHRLRIMKLIRSLPVTSGSRCLPSPIKCHPLPSPHHETDCSPPMLSRVLRAFSQWVWNKCSFLLCPWKISAGKESERIPSKESVR